MKELQYPFDNAYILKKKKSIRKALLTESGSGQIPIKVAILGGSTTSEIKNILELFLLNQRLQPTFYESEYAKYWEDAMFGEALADFAPDVVYIHTTGRNIEQFPLMSDSKAQVAEKLAAELERYRQMWERLRQAHQCLVIQNNFERPTHRLLGNQDISDFRGRASFVQQLNQAFYEYAQTHEHFFINDIEYLSASYGLAQWADPRYWHMYKYALSLEAIPELAFNLANIIKSAYGRNKKALVLDLDNTLWGGVIGDDGAEGIQIGPELPAGQVYSEFQAYLKQQKDLGVLLAVCSKNDMENALAGLNHPDSTLRPEDFVAIQANWENKDENVLAIAKQLSLGADSFVFVDDNPAERAIVAAQIADIAVPEMGSAPEQYIHILDRNGFFEATGISQDDAKRSEMYQANAARQTAAAAFQSHADYLKSLEMTAEIRGFSLGDLQRITQLTNKTNQFNLTTKRYSQSEIATAAEDENKICLCGRLSDRFGDNGIVSVIIGTQAAEVLHLDLWLMSCRVLKRDMEYAMFDALIQRCRAQEIRTIIGYYYKTAKNQMVQDFYGRLGFVKTATDAQENTVWQYDVDGYLQKSIPISAKLI